MRMYLDIDVTKGVIAFELTNLDSGELLAWGPVGDADDRERVAHVMASEHYRGASLMVSSSIDFPDEYGASAEMVDDLLARTRRAHWVMLRNTFLGSPL